MHGIIIIDHKRQSDERTRVVLRGTRSNGHDDDRTLNPCIGSATSLVAETLSWLLWVVSVLVRKVTETTEALKRRMQSTIYGPKS